MTELDLDADCLHLGLCTDSCPGLRPETDEDNDFLLALYISTRETGLRQSGWSETEIHAFLTQQFETQRLSYRQLYPHASFQLITIQGEAIGRLYLDRGEEEYRLIDISLLPAYRNRHLGRDLIQSILDEATKKGKPVSLHVEHHNPAYSLYVRLGFVPIENDGVYILMQWRLDNTAPV